MQELFTQLGIDWRLLLIQTINFLLILYLLKRFVFGKILQLMEERRQRIEQGLEMRKQAEQEMQRIHELRKTELEQARQEAETIIAEAKSIAESREQQILEKTRTEAERMLLQAREEIGRERDEAMKEAKKEMLGIAIIAAEKILQRTITEGDRERVAKEALESIESAYAK